MAGGYVDGPVREACASCARPGSRSSRAAARFTWPTAATTASARLQPAMYRPWPVREPRRAAMARARPRLFARSARAGPGIGVRAVRDGLCRPAHPSCRAGRPGNDPVGRGSGYQDGTIALFNYPRGVAAGPDGNVYVADQGNHVIRQIRTLQQTVLSGAGGVVTHTTTTRQVTVGFPPARWPALPRSRPAWPMPADLPAGLTPVGGAFTVRAQDAAGSPVTAFRCRCSWRLALGAPEVAGLSPEALAQLALYTRSENTASVDQDSVRLRPGRPQARLPASRI